MTHATHPIPPPSWSHILHQAMYEGYLQQLDNLMTRKARYWETLVDQDRFKLNEEQNQRLQKRLDSIAEEVTILENLRHAIPDLANHYLEHLHRLERERDCWKEQYRSCKKTEAKLIDAMYLEIVKPAST